MKPSDAVRLAAWRAEAAQPFGGWDFSYLAGRMLEDAPPWDYLALAAARMDQAAALLDMDTGGGEKLLALRDHWPPRVTVTEAHPPNVALVRERLGPLGVRVVDFDCTEVATMPFDDGEFDLILNRHGSFNPDELGRVLAPGGVFLTQQVHGLYAADLLARFGATPPWPDATPERYVPWLARAGLQVVDVQTWAGTLRFTDVGALVYYLAAVPWMVPEFSVDRYAEVLLDLHAQVEGGVPLVFSARLYLIEARKPG